MFNNRVHLLVKGILISEYSFLTFDCTKTIFQFVSQTFSEAEVGVSTYIRRSTSFFLYNVIPLAWSVMRINRHNSDLYSTVKMENSDDKVAKKNAGKEDN